MPRISRSALLPYTAADMFGIVNDVARYPEFLPWCTAAAVVEETAEEVVAALSLKRGGVTETFTTRNLLTPFEKIEMVLVSGPFRELSGGWTFARLGEDEGCRITLELEFRLAGMRSLLGGMFDKAADQMVDAFSARARTLLHPTV